MDVSASECYKTRRASVAAGLPDSLLLFQSGFPRSRNFPDATFPFRCASSVLFLCGAVPAGSVLAIQSSSSGGTSTLFVQERDADYRLWFGESESLDDLAARTGVECVESIAKLPEQIHRARTFSQKILLVADFDLGSRNSYARWLNYSEIDPYSPELLQVLIQQRLRHDEFGLTQLRQAALISEKCYQELCSISNAEMTEKQLVAALMYAIVRRGCQPAFTPIVTATPAVLHPEVSARQVGAMPWVLVDFGVELESGYCSDCTRMLALTERVPTAAQELYAMVLEVQEALIAMVRPGVRFGELDLLAERKIADGLVKLGILRGSVDELVEREVASRFFPHGLGHALGIDVHDMEEFGDAVGYPPGRQRPNRFGRTFLRFDRDLEIGMAITVEPGCYFSPVLMQQLLTTSTMRPSINESTLEKFAIFGGVRIEDTVVVAAGDAEVLTARVSKKL